MLRLLLLDPTSWHYKMSLEWLFIYDTLKLTNWDYITLHDAEKKTNAWIAAINDLREDRVLDTIFIIT